MPDSGAWHGAEILVLFDSFYTGNSMPALTDEEREIGKFMRDAWAAFAMDPRDGLTNSGWPRYDPDRKTLVRLAFEDMNGTNLDYPEACDVNCQTIFPIN